MVLGSARYKTHRKMSQKINQRIFLLKRFFRENQEKTFFTLYNKRCDALLLLSCDHLSNILVEGSEI